MRYIILIIVLLINNLNSFSQQYSVTSVRESLTPIGVIAPVSVPLANARAVYLFNNAKDRIQRFNGKNWTAKLKEDCNGLLNESFCFDGNNDYVTYDFDSSILSGDFTVSFDFKTVKQERSDIIKIGDFTASDNLTFITSDGSVGIQAFWNGGGANSINNSDNYHDGQWRTVTLVRNSGTITLYIDNVEKGTFDYTPAVAGSKKMIIGGDEANRYFEGCIDNLYFFDTALNSSERLNLVNSCKPVACDIDFHNPEGLALKVGSQHNIEFHSENVSTVDLEYYNGTAWVSIANNVSSPYLWTIPNTITDIARIRTTACGKTFESDLFSIHNYGWTELNSNTPYGPMDGGGAVVLNDSMYILGGWEPANIPSPFTHSEIWRSKDGVTWTQIGTAPWSPRHTAVYLVYNSKMYVIGDDLNDGSIEGDVWSSSNGINLTLEATNLPNLQRILHMGFVKDGKMWVGGGQLDLNTPSTYYNDWYSSTDGVNWVLETADSGYPERGMTSQFSVTPEGTVWQIGGGTYITDYLRDVWKSDNPVNGFVEVTRIAPFKGVQYHSQVYYDDKIWKIAGTSGINEDEIWYSNKDDGKNWFLLMDNPIPSRHASSVFIFEGALFITGGTAVGTIARDAWKLE